MFFVATSWKWLKKLKNHRDRIWMWNDSCKNRNELSCELFQLEWAFVNYIIAVRQTSNVIWWAICGCWAPLLRCRQIEAVISLYFDLTSLFEAHQKRTKVMAVESLQLLDNTNLRCWQLWWWLRKPSNFRLPPSKLRAEQTTKLIRRKYAMPLYINALRLPTNFHFGLSLI